MQKIFSGGSTINYGAELPPVESSVNGLLYHINTGSKKGLYILSNPPLNSNSSQGPHGWHPVIETELYVLRAGDTMTGPLVLKRDGNANNITSAPDSLDFLASSSYINHHYGAMRWKVGGSTNAQISAVTTDNNGITAVVISTRGPEGSLVERLRIDHNGLKFGNHTIWHSGNDGAGSGLDADLLDGQHGAYYLDLNNSTGTLPVSSLPFMPVQQGGISTQQNSKIHIGELSAKSGRLGLKMGSTDYADTWPINISGSTAYFTQDIRMTVGNSTKNFDNGPIAWPSSHVTFNIHEIGAVSPIYQENLGRSFYIDPVGGVDDIENGYGYSSKPYRTISFVCNRVLPQYSGMVTLALANRGVHDSSSFYFLHGHPISLVAWNAFGSGKPTLTHVPAICKFLNITGMRLNSISAETGTCLGIFDCDFIGSLDVSHGVKGAAISGGGGTFIGMLGTIRFSGTYESGLKTTCGTIAAFPTGPTTFAFSGARFNNAFVNLIGGYADLTQVLTMSGSFTGRRFNAFRGSRLYTGTGNPNFFPGSTDGFIEGVPALPSYYY